MEDGPAASPPRRGAAVSGERQATLRDVARAAGVSQATASRVLNGSIRNVRQGNAARVLAAAAELGYAPHLSAQAIARGSTNTVALVVSGVDDPYFSSIAAGVTQAAEAAGLIVTMAVAGRSPERELQIVRTLRGMRPRAIILTGSRIDGSDTRDALVEEFDAYRDAGGSVVLISQHDLPFRTVSIDDYGGARQLARALAGLGYRRFAVVCAGGGLRTSRDRCGGFMDGLREFDIDINEQRVVEAEFSRRGGCAAARELVRRGLDGTELVFAVSDVMAIGAMTAFRDAGLVPGQDVAVAGFDDIGPAVDVVPELTTVTVPLRQLGLRAMELALSDDDASRIVQVSTSVVLRGSTRRLPRPRADDRG
ncbi:LacI family transcriptional regulator [Streptomyces cahuitamycinicus]|uniref:LacI family transcriptional regulator n=1 Tax=Streptomyces cahuitamycinicus TaxID=2070367 RepID=A0A2N8TU35_9ACTN|nr:LacI family transcriptional regulator [Streptomyces cahuitamycinicus]